MQDEALVALLLTNKAQSVALVGEPVFRLKPLLSAAWPTQKERLGEQPSEHPSEHFIVGGQAEPRSDNELASHEPQISCYLTVEDFEQSGERTAMQTGEWILCMHLPSGVDSAETMLGRACRSVPKLVVVEHERRQNDDELLGDEQFFAQGFRKLDYATDVYGPQRSWYAYSLRAYKQAPDWLNAKFWARPERFGIKE